MKRLLFFPLSSPDPQVRVPSDPSPGPSGPIASKHAHADGPPPAIGIGGPPPPSHPRAHAAQPPPRTAPHSDRSAASAAAAVGRGGGGGARSGNPHPTGGVGSFPVVIDSEAEEDQSYIGVDDIDAGSGEDDNATDGGGNPGDANLKPPTPPSILLHVTPPPDIFSTGELLCLN
jgi:hypothetical protein